MGEETSRTLAQHFGSIKKLKEAKEEKLLLLSDIGVEVSKSIFQWFNDHKNIEMVDDLIGAGVRILPLEKVVTLTKLVGKSFVITGSLDSMTRAEAHEKIRLLGGHPLTSLSKKTDFLVVGTDPSSKVQKAQKLGVKAISEKEFVNMLK